MTDYLIFDEAAVPAIAVFLDARLDEHVAAGVELDRPFSIEVARVHKRIVNLYVSSWRRDAWMRDSTGWAPLELATTAYLEVVRTLAALRDSHPDYREEWRP